MARATRLPDHPVARAAIIQHMLAGAGLRVTRPRQAIAEVLLLAWDHPDAEAVLARARAIDPSISQATTYRTLAVLADKGYLRTHNFGTGGARYEVAEQHHDHLVDVDTGAVMEFVSAEIEALQQKIADRFGYDIVDHQLVLFGKQRAKG
ncbi:transcriptional repressor [Paracoccus suum]|uniref:Ferric uptake regulation protein n=2 Tax=Paracoccus suum TaxID=2259340 RepID=A0A344PKS7_9RHOB|nr:transcriptional repressor [Paracoccus suum]